MVKLPANRKQKSNAFVGHSGLHIHQRQVSKVVRKRQPSHNEVKVSLSQVEPNTNVKTRSSKRTSGKRKAGAAAQRGCSTSASPRIDPDQMTETHFNGSGIMPLILQLRNMNRLDVDDMYRAKVEDVTPNAWAERRMGPRRNSAPARYFGNEVPVSDNGKKQAVIGCAYCGEPDHEPMLCHRRGCWTCNSKDHLQNECKFSGVTCTFCHCKGHDMERCPRAIVEESINGTMSDKVRCIACGQRGHYYCSSDFDSVLSFQQYRSPYCCKCGDGGHSHETCVPRHHRRHEHRARSGSPRSRTEGRSEGRGHWQRERSPLIQRMQSFSPNRHHHNEGYSRSLSNSHEIRSYQRSRDHQRSRDDGDISSTSRGGGRREPTRQQSLQQYRGRHSDSHAEDQVWRRVDAQPWASLPSASPSSSALLPHPIRQQDRHVSAAPSVPFPVLQYHGSPTEVRLGDFHEMQTQNGRFPRKSPNCSGEEDEFNVEEAEFKREYEMYRQFEAPRTERNSRMDNRYNHEISRTVPVSQNYVIGGNRRVSGCGGEWTDESDEPSPRRAAARFNHGDGRRSRNHSSRRSQAASHLDNRRRAR